MRLDTRLVAQCALAGAMAWSGVDVWAVEPAPPLRVDVEKAVKMIQDDPDISRVGTRMTWQWQSDRTETASDNGPRDSWDGFLSAVRTIASVLRVLVWILGAVAVGFVLMNLRRWWQERADSRRVQTDAVRPTHVRDLDIRPESLPDDVGQAAWIRWQRGDATGALSLLYRGALSRLVHGHRVPVLASSTEGECVTLCRQHAQASCGDYFETLVPVWQSVVYGDHHPSDDTMRSLCTEFQSRLGAPGGGA